MTCPECCTGTLSTKPLNREQRIFEGYLGLTVALPEGFEGQVCSACGEVWIDEADAERYDGALRRAVFEMAKGTKA